MGFFKRLGNHVLYNGLGTQSQGAKVARDAVKKAKVDHPVVELGAVATGATAGSVIGGMKMLSPDAILETASKSEEELDRRVEEMGPWGGIEDSDYDD